MWSSFVQDLGHSQENQSVSWRKCWYDLRFITFLVNTTSIELLIHFINIIIYIILCRTRLWSKVQSASGRAIACKALMGEKEEMSETWNPNPTRYKQRGLCKRPLFELGLDPWGIYILYIYIYTYCTIQLGSVNLYLAAALFLNRFQSLQNPTMRRQSQTYASQHTKPRGQL